MKKMTWGTDLQYQILRLFWNTSKLAFQQNRPGKPEIKTEPHDTVSQCNKKTLHYNSEMKHTKNSGRKQVKVSSANFFYKCPDSKYLMLCRSYQTL